MLKKEGVARVVISKDEVKFGHIRKIRALFSAIIYGETGHVWIFCPKFK